jgi:hypothetical protein
MQRWKFSREFKLEAVRLVKDRGVAVAQAAVIGISMRTYCANGSGISLPIRSMPFPVMGR